MENIKVYRYRWVVLAVFMLVNAIIQIHWVNFAPITGEAANYYHVSTIKIGLLSLCYMFVYIVLCVPASYVIDRYGLRVGVGIGVLLTAVFAIFKGFFAESYTAVLISQFGLASAQPFIMNAITKIGAKWFPIHERATAAGFSALSQYLGIIAAMVVSPLLFTSYSMKGMLMVYAVISVVSSAVFFVLMRENPPSPPSIIPEDMGIDFFEGLKDLFKLRDMILLIILFFIGLGMFNAVTTWIEQILGPRGFSSEQAGLVGAAMMVGGVLGAILLPVLSDKLSIRKKLLSITMAGTIPGLIGLTYASSFPLLMVSAGILGFFIMAAGPIGFQYGAEISYPIHESTSQGIILLAGQVSGIIFVFAMDHFRSVGGAMTPFLVVFLVLMALSVVISLFMKESELVKIEGAIEDLSC